MPLSEREKLRRRTVYRERRVATCFAPTRVYTAEEALKGKKERLERRLHGQRVQEQILQGARMAEVDK